MQKSTENGISTDEKSDWHDVSVCKTLYCHRTGWFGVWDAITALWKKEKRYSYPSKVKISFFMKRDANVYLQSVQVEELTWDDATATGCVKTKPATNVETTPKPS